MRFDEVAARLASLPSRLPPPPAALVPVRVGESAARPWAGSPRDGRPAAVLVLIVPDDDGEARIVLTERTIDDWTIRYGAYAVEGLLVWGATARILGQLGALLAIDGNLETGGNLADMTGV